jgi:UDP-N-acetylmuramoyl-tripeptide--D-alanyl-D-alanine ligase
MRAALVDLVERAGERRRVAILGEMAELGDASEAYHREIGELAAELEISVIGVGALARAYDPVVWATGPDEVLPEIQAFLRRGDVVLVKASRAIGLEGIAAEITNFARAWSPS